MTRNSINHPSHYAGGRQFEPIGVIEDWGLNFNLGNSLKYISRAGRKDPAKTVEDLKKAVWYLEREIAALEGSQEPLRVSYEDVLDYQAAEAANGSVPIYEYSINISNATEGDRVDFWESWDSDDDFMWDPSLGPVEPTEDEIFDVLSRKDLDQFSDNEIVSSFERRGIIFGVKKDGSSCILGDNGRCT